MIINKFPLPNPCQVNTLYLPQGAEILSVINQGNISYLKIMYDSRKTPLENREFLIFFEDEEIIQYNCSLTYIGSSQYDDGSVFYVFERKLV